MAKTKSVWVCNQCGAQEYKWAGACSACKSWDSLEEMQIAPESKSRVENPMSGNAKPVLLHEVEEASHTRTHIGYRDFNRLMGSGVVRGSLNLIGGDPGIGKSTLMLQLSKEFAEQGLTVLYISGEESAQQTSLRAQRLGVKSDRIYIYSETDFSQVKHHVSKLQPDVLIVDSIQIVYKPDLSSLPGSVTQVKEIALECMHMAKGMNITTFIIGHVTKSGELAGPRVLEHIVDTVLDFEGDKHQGYRMVRASKNRFGPTDEVAIFQMNEEGLHEVLNPSMAFLQERSHQSTGSVIVPTLEGTRSILVEVQALVSPSSFSTSSRKCMGIDQTRLTMLLAVLEKRGGYNFGNMDVFVSVAGGMRVVEPAIDLGVVMAMASSFSNKPVDPNTLIVGEVGLGGELRSVTRVENRIKESIHMGFTTCILPKKNLKGLSKSVQTNIKLIGVERIDEAINLLV
ncbi:MAG: DNA repair protein RadA [Chlamydiia bacterium]|nr:DNA repair protein RadA [Chlamydiia bacterium]